MRVRWGHRVRDRATLVAATGASMALSGLAGASCFLARPSPAAIPAAPPQLGASAVRFASASGSVIHAWMIPGRPGGGAVLLLHGVGANREAMLGRALFLHAEGFTVLAPDFQAHGESPGEHPTFGALESLDAAAALSYLHAHAHGERVGVIGVSMGGAAALLGPGPLPADALVLESVYPTIRDAVRDRLQAWLGPLGFISSGLTPVVIDAVAPRIGVRESELQPIERIDRVREPLLLIAGTRDRYTKLDEARALYARATAPKQFWAVRGAGHVDLHAFAPAEYERRVGTFLVAHLRRPPAPPRDAAGNPSDGRCVDRPSRLTTAPVGAEQRAEPGRAAQQLAAGQRECR